MKQFPPYSLTVQQVLKTYKTSATTGLNSQQVNSRLRLYGKNKLKEKEKINSIILFLKQFKGFMIYILLFAIIVAGLAKEFIDASLILVIVLLNVTFGFIQEYKAEKAIAALKKLALLKAKVIRNGKLSLIDADNLVPGDIIVVEEGTKISADARVIQSASLYAQEAALTGESTPVEKGADQLQERIFLAERENMIFSGTVVTQGKAIAVVAATGMNTEIGKIATLITKTKKELTPLQKKIETLGKWICFATIILSFLIFIIGIIQQGLFLLLFSGRAIEFLIGTKEWLLTSVALSVAAVPEGLPAIVVITLAIGARKMLKRNALTRKLSSVETLGSTTVICSDKTGTLTENKMTVQRVYVNNKEIKIIGEEYKLKGKLESFQKVTEQDLLVFEAGVICNNASLENEKGKIKIVGDPTEVALLVSAERAGINHRKLRHVWMRVKEEPFDSIKKMMATLNKDPKTKKYYVFAKGAPESIIEKCDKFLVNGRIVPLTQKRKEAILKKNEEFTKQALRVLAFAFKEHQKQELLYKNLVYIGLQAMKDQPRTEVKEAVQKCKDAGIKIVMVTGDNLYTAQAIAKEIGIEGNAMQGDEFLSLPKQKQLSVLSNTSIFSRVEPKHKLTIVRLLQSQGEIVAMTGDGVNDAPAIKKADIGIAMGITGTDVTKETSDLILQDDNFASIVNAIEEGRSIKENIRKFINYLFSSNLAEVLVIITAILLKWPLPMTAVMILWLNLVTDGLPALALGVDPNPKEIMKSPPKKKLVILDKVTTVKIVYIATLIAIGVLGLLYWAMARYASLEPALHTAKIQTIAFTTLIMLEFVRLQAIRSEYKLGILSNKYLVLAVVLSILLQLVVIYTPFGVLFGTTTLAFIDWAMILSVAAGIFLINVVIFKLAKRKIV